MILGNKTLDKSEKSYDDDERILDGDDDDGIPDGIDDMLLSLFGVPSFPFPVPPLFPSILQAQQLVRPFLALELT